MPINIDTLQIEINASANKANQAIDKLVVKLDRLNTSLNGINGNNLTSLSNGISRLSQAMVTLNSVDSAKLGDVTNKIKRLSNIKADTLLGVSDNLNKIASSMRGLQSVSDSIKNLSDLANGIKQLGYKSATKAIDNIPKLATAMNQLMTELSKAPKVSQNLINMTNALAKLSRTGASSGRAASSLSKGWNIYSNSATRATKSTHSLASAFGKMYATYWLVFRAFGKLAEAIDISSQLTEVQNVVDVTFGSYVDKVEALSDISIPQLGMSELETKKISSRFQAMGTAMGFAQGSMADMSVELTRLTADMASFYNVEQDAVAEDLSAIFTGQTRPMRQYGIDLTQATLKEWALQQGLNANIESMSQMEKTLLRYQYVMANTGAAQGDFLRTQNTWANQVRILKNNLQQLATVIGGTLINALKPLVKALNVAMQQLIAFAKTVSDALGKIFGWEYEAGTGGVTSDLETGADYADELAGGMDNAADAAKRLKSHLLSIDELNVLEPQKEEDSISGGGISGGLGDLGNEVSNGNWIKTDSLFKKFESELDTLYKLGDYIGQTLSRAMESIEWDNVYEKAQNFGKGLAEFLNGLISPRLFGNVGRTIANSLNTVIQASLSFAENFDFEEFGVSLATGINDFFNNFDFKSLAKSINKWVDGIKDAIAGFLKTIDLTAIARGIGDFLGTLELDTVAIMFTAFSIKNSGRNLTLLIGNAISGKLSNGINIPQLLITISSFSLANLNTAGFTVIANEIVKEIENALDYIIPDWLSNWIGEFVAGFSLSGVASGGNLVVAIFGGLISGLPFKDIVFDFSWADGFFKQMVQSFEKIASEQDWMGVGIDIIDGIAAGMMGALAFILQPVHNLFTLIFNGICDVFGINSPAENMKPLGEYIFLGIVEGFQSSFMTFTESLALFWNDYVSPWFTSEKWSRLYSAVKTELQNTWDSVMLWWETSGIYRWYNSDVKPWFSKDKWSFVGIKEGLVSAWEAAVEGVKAVWNRFANWFNSKMSITLPSIEVAGQRVFDGKTIEFIRLPTFATGGFPEDGLFMANHNELVGQFSNGKTAVANNEQIIEGITRGVAQANMEEVVLLNQAVGILTELVGAVREGRSITIDGRELVEAYDNRKTRNGYAF